MIDLHIVFDILCWVFVLACIYRILTQDPDPVKQALSFDQQYRSAFMSFPEVLILVNLETEQVENANHIARTAFQLNENDMDRFSVYDFFVETGKLRSCLAAGKTRFRISAMSGIGATFDTRVLASYFLFHSKKYCMICAEFIKADNKGHEINGMVTF